jgi:hypothetical protein
MPEWAAERATEIGAGFAKNIAGLGIRVVGDLDSLGTMPSKCDESSDPPAMVPANIAASAIIAAIAASLQAGQIDGKAATSVLNKEAPPEQKLHPAVKRSLLRARKRTKGY